MTGLLAQGFDSSPSAMVWLFVIALVVSSVGFYRVVYFISIGYAFSITVMAVSASLVLRDQITRTPALQNLLLIVWGLRLGIFLLRREVQPSYRKELDAIHDRSGGMNWLRRVGIWIGVSLLYVCMYSPSLFNLMTGSTPPSLWVLAVQVGGLAIMAGGLIVEAVADRQKLAFRALHLGQFCDVGFYRWVRAPTIWARFSFGWATELPASSSTQRSAFGLSA